MVCTYPWPQMFKCPPRPTKKYRKKRVIESQISTETNTTNTTSIYTKADEEAAPTRNWNAPLAPKKKMQKINVRINIVLGVLSTFIKN